MLLLGILSARKLLVSLNQPEKNDERGREKERKRKREKERYGEIERRKERWQMDREYKEMLDAIEIKVRKSNGFSGNFHRANYTYGL